MANIVDGPDGSRCLWKQQKAEARAWRINGTSQKTSENLQQCWESRRSRLFFFCSRTIPAEGARCVKTFATYSGTTGAFLAFYLQRIMKNRDSRMKGAAIYWKETKRWETNMVGSEAWEQNVCLLYYLQGPRPPTCKWPLNKQSVS